MAENKVQFNLKNVHYAVLTMSGTTPSWAPPVAVTGAVSLSLDAEGDMNNFYADGGVYYTSVANNGYSGSLEMARITDQMMEDIFGVEVDSSGVMVESALTEPKEFALLYQIDGDSENEFYCLYRCKASRPSLNAETTEDSKEPVTQTMTFTAAPLPASGKVYARTTSTTQSSTKSAWFSAVYTA